MGCLRPLVLLVQLPIPPSGAQPVCGNVPLAPAYLKLFARRHGLEETYRIEILPSRSADALGDQGIVEEILGHQPWMVGFTCYVWNIERTLWVATCLKEARPELKIVLGGPEITPDNDMPLRCPAVDYAVVGEGEQTFAELLAALRAAPAAEVQIPGLVARDGSLPAGSRRPLENLDAISSPYLEGILDAADEKLMLLETVRGCRFRCKFCSYPKGYGPLCFLSEEQIAANLRHAGVRGVREVALLDPTLNQRPDFVEFLRLAARCNPDRRFAYTAELRSEGIGTEHVRLLRRANVAEVEVGLQSIDATAQTLMGRPVNLEALARGTRAMLDAGIRVRVDLILGLPGDTVDSVRRGIDYLRQRMPDGEVQVFNLSVLPGTAFRREARQLGLVYQSRPPYYVLQTPTLTLDDLYVLMEEAQEAFQIEFDPWPAPRQDAPPQRAGAVCAWDADLDAGPITLPPASRRALAFTLRLRSADFDQRRRQASELLGRLVADNPHSTLEVIVEPAAPERLSQATLGALQAACFSSTSYLDLAYSLHPNPLLGAKRLVVSAPLSQRARLGKAWIDQVGRYAAILWSGGMLPEEELAGHEYCDAPRG